MANSASASLTNEILRRHRAGDSIRVIASAVGLCPQSVHERLRSHPKYVSDHWPLRPALPALKARRQELGLTLRALRDMTGVPTSKLSYIELGEHRARPRDVETLSSALGRPAEALFASAESRTPPKRPDPLPEVRARVELRRDAAVKLRSELRTFEEIGRELGVSLHTAWKDVVAAGISTRHQTTLVCAFCGNTFPVSWGEAKRRRFCGECEDERRNSPEHKAAVSEWMQAWWASDRSRDYRLSRYGHVDKPYWIDVPCDLCGRKQHRIRTQVEAKRVEGRKIIGADCCLPHWGPALSRARWAFLGIEPGSRPPLAPNALDVHAVAFNAALSAGAKAEDAIRASWPHRFGQRRRIALWIAVEAAFQHGYSDRQIRDIVNRIVEGGHSIGPLKHSVSERYITRLRDPDKARIKRHGDPVTRLWRNSGVVGIE